MDNCLENILKESLKFNFINTIETSLIDVTSFYMDIMKHFFLDYIAAIGCQLMNRKLLK